MHAVLEKISKSGLVPVIKLDDPDKAVDLATALKKGGIPVAEATFRAEGADRAIAAIASIETADLYGLKVLDKNINASSINTTRIYVATTGREHRRRMEVLHLLI